MAVLNLTSANFAQEVQNSTVPVVVDFWASWCGPCQMLGPIVDALSEEVSGVKVMKCNVDEEMALAMKFGINSIPAVLKFKGGEVVDTSVGVVPKEQLKSFMLG